MREICHYFICTKCKKYGGLLEKATNFVDIIRSKAFLLAHHDCWKNPSDLIDLYKRNCCIVRQDLVPEDYTSDEAECFELAELFIFRNQIDEDIENYSEKIELYKKSN
jgi:hypothetical protein